MKTKKKIHYSVQTKSGKVKSYIDKRFCYCEAYPAAHIHQKTEKGE